MINYFLNEQEPITLRKKKFISKYLLGHRKYNPYHLDCPHSKKKLCYCTRTPIEAMSAPQRLYLWEHSYRRAY